MARIFLSYSREDRTLAHRIAAVLEAAGFDVWWDRYRVLPGESFAETSKRELTRADQVLVLWSPHSEGDRWVWDEAREAQVRGKLVLVLVGAAFPPRGFRTISTFDLAEWDGSFEAPQARMLVEALDRFGDRSNAPVAVGRSPAARPGRAAGSVFEVLGGAVGALAAGAAELASSAGRAVRALGKRIGARRAQARDPIEPAGRPGNSPPPDLERDSGSFPGADDERTLIVRPPASPAQGSGEEVADLLSSDDGSAPVMLGVAAPRRAQAGSSFSARFVAYVPAARQSAQRHLKELGEKDDRAVLDIPPDRAPHWRVGAPVTVRLGGEHVTISPSERSFEWNGRENVVNFAVNVDADAPATQIQLCFHVFLGPVEISVISIGVALVLQAGDSSRSALRVSAPSSAFASYALKDAEQVARSLSTLAHWAPSLDIFQDCLDLTPNEEFKPQLEAQIAARDVFLLFWSRNAMASQWVRWELDTARAKPGLDAILPMPLEDPALAPPPPGFEDRHLRDRYLMAGYGLARIAELAAASPPSA